MAIQKMRVRAITDSAKNLRHPTGSVIGRDGTADWPRDQFTFRRIRDGDLEKVSDDQSNKE